MKKKLILVGGGGHCRACIDIIETENKFKIIGIVDLKEKLHKKISGYEVIAGDEDSSRLAKEYEYFLITIGYIKNAEKRIEKFEYLKKLGAKFPVVASPLAYVSKNAFIDEGTIIMHKAFVNANAKIGKNCIINTASVIEHDASIGNQSHISTGSIVNGECAIGEGVFVGSNSVVSNNVSIAKNVIIGAGSSVVKSITETGIYAGSPARKLDKNE